MFVFENDDILIIQGGEETISLSYRYKFCEISYCKTCVTNDIMGIDVVIHQSQYELTNERHFGGLSIESNSNATKNLLRSLQNHCSELSTSESV